MEPFDTVIAHYSSEIGIKGLNRPFFEKRLVSNLTLALKGLNIERIYRDAGRVVILAKEGDIRKIAENLSKVFGISWFSYGFRSPKAIDLIVEKTLEGIRSLSLRPSSFKVIASRADKKFPINSMEIARLVGTKVKEEGLKVDLNNPELTLYVEIADKYAYILFNKRKGLGGLPVGVSGRVLCLLSGGIDSPVASWLAMKRGCKVSFLHLHAMKDKEEVLRSKLMKIVKKLSEYCFSTTVYLIPFHDFYFRSFKIPPKMELVMFRRYMMLLAEKVALSEGYKAIVTGDSIGQVASQTLENIASVSNDISLPIIRPLASYDKEEIVNIAKKIGTYEASIEEYKDCCSIIARHPETKASVDHVKKLEKEIELENVVNASLDKMEKIEINY